MYLRICSGADVYEIMESDVKRRILFVDDEQNILEGLRRMLRSMRHELDMSFVDSGAAALELMDTQSFDVIVSDMRMPSMDGAQLLTEVKERAPHTIRIILTGQADEDSILRTVGVTHQFLAKPCKPDRLKEVIKRSCSLHDLLNNGDLKNVISGIGQLPSLPDLYNKLQAALSEPDVTTEEVGAIIEQDMAMSAKILQLVNSSFFGLLQRVETPSRAVKLLGLDTIKVLALGLEIFSEMKAERGIVTAGKLWTHSVAVANCARLVATEAGADHETVVNSFIAGLLHDIGQLIMISEMGEEYDKVLDLVSGGEVLLSEAEKQVFKATHCDIGAYLMGLWGFNGSVVEAIGFQNRLQDYPPGSFNAALAVHIANIVYYHTYPEMLIGSPLAMNEEYLALSGLSTEADHWVTICADYLKEAAEAG